MKKVLIITDLVKGFCLERYPLFCGDAVKRIIPFVVKKAAEYKKKKDWIIFVVDWHDENDLEFKMFPRHCVKNSKETEIIDELALHVKGEMIIHKKRYSAFFGTRLAKILKKIAPDVVEIVGVCTDICVYFTVEELRSRDYKVNVYEKGVASFNRAAHRFALEQMEKVLGAKVL